jgi:hypothetical protein
MAAFGRETREGLRAFPAQYVSAMDYKLSLRLDNAKLRMQRIGCGTRLRLRGGVVLFASDFLLRIPAKDHATPKDYTIFVPSSNRKCMISVSCLLACSLSDSLHQKHYSRVIDSNAFCNRGELCMLLTEARVELEFRQDARLYLSSTEKVRLTVAQGCQLALWTSDRVNALPLRYEYVADMGARSALFYICLHHRYYQLLRQPDLNQHYDIVLPSRGYVRFTQGETVSNKYEEGYCYTHKDRKAGHFVSRDYDSYLLDLNEQGSNETLMRELGGAMEVESTPALLPPHADTLSRVIGPVASSGTRPLQSSTHRLSHLQLSHIQVYFKDPVTERQPRFTLRDARNKKTLHLVVTEDRYAVQGVYYSIYGLALQPGGELLCHFVLSENRQFIVFIAVTR